MSVLLTHHTEEKHQLYVSELHFPHVLQAKYTEDCQLENVFDFVSLIYKKQRMIIRKIYLFKRCHYLEEEAVPQEYKGDG